MKRIFFVILSFIALVVVSCAVTNQSGSSTSQFKNLKVLPKDITPDQLDSVMHHFTASLNVKCNFCHVRNPQTNEMDWPSDGNKHKNIAREMITMTNDINKKYFDHTGASITLTSKLAVTCYTCHHGKKEPVSIAPQTEKP